MPINSGILDSAARFKISCFHESKIASQPH
jgi:hypothetical protein